MIVLLLLTVGFEYPYSAILTSKSSIFEQFKWIVDHRLVAYRQQTLWFCGRHFWYARSLASSHHDRLKLQPVLHDDDRLQKRTENQNKRRTGDARLDLDLERVQVLKSWQIAFSSLER